MRNAKKLLALVLAFMMVLGTLPAVSAQTVHTHGIEEYPELTLNEETLVAISEPGMTVYMRFTPAVTAVYTFQSIDAHQDDPNAYLYDAEMNQLAYHEDNGYDSGLGYNDLNFTLTYELEAGKTYVYAVNLYNENFVRDVLVLLSADLPSEHNYVGVVTTEPTCESDGVMTYTCTECGDSYTEVIPGGHIFENGFCTRCGEERILTGVCGDNLTWTLNGSGVLTISGTGNMYDFSYHYEPMIPWADHIEEIKSVVIEDGAASIGNFAFSNAVNLTSVTLPDTLTVIGESAFRSCIQLTNVVWSENLVDIKGFAFMDCAALTSADLGSKIELIGNSAFYGCSGLEEVNLGESLLGINTLAFSGCTSLTEISMPDTVEALGSDVFNGCTALTTVKLSNGLKNLPAYTFNECTSLVNVTMPEYLTTIGERCFYYCQSLESIDLPFSLIAMDNDAFGHCVKLHDIEFPMALSYVGYFAFNGCSALGNMEFPPNLTYFTGGMFYDCTGLTEIIFPMGTTYVDDDAFAGCSNVKKIVFTGDLPTVLGAFVDIEADAWYPAGNETWTSDALLNYGGSLTWHAMCAEHSFGKWTPVVDATCTESGIEERTCSVCKWTEQRVSEPHGHIWDEGEENEDGEIIYTCLICGATSDELPFINPFTDVKEGDWFYDAVCWAVKGGITTGATDTLFNPNGKCQRAQVVTFLWRAAGCPEPTTTNNPFSDVKESDFFYKAVLWAVEEGITNGTSDTAFSPYIECNRAAVVTFLYRAMGEPEVGSVENPFSDVVVTDFYGPAVLWAVENGITNGLSTNEFGVSSICNRAQVVTFLYRTYNK
ncbi:MAG: leucine-rich repeat protein [Oscillospiraceae bacterium]|nr:leucine-rich repeat protein [Oscillospiraceae bacterium]